MATHEFGILPQAPAPGQRYDSYEPEKYHCISIDDETLAPVLAELDHIPTFWHTLDLPCFGLNDCGVTLLPPSSFDSILAAIQSQVHLDALYTLLLNAKADNRYIIHYGL